MTAMQVSSDLLSIIKDLLSLVVVIVALWRIVRVDRKLGHVTELVNSRDTVRNEKIDDLTKRIEQLLDINMKLQTSLNKAQDELSDKKRWPWGRKF